MSRAVDEDTKRALEHDVCVKAFRALTEALSQQHDGLLEVEILGSSHNLDANASCLQDGPAIAVSKVGLVQAFVIGRDILQDVRSGAQKHDSSTIMDATAVLLLTDPEHLTAANTRKRTLTSQLLYDVGQSLLLRDLYFVDSLLTSRLHRHTKSPNLWSHRRWLTSQLGRLHAAPEATNVLSNVIFVSAQRHPRNYYAWSHARLLFPSLEQDRPSLAVAIRQTEQWCYAHHDDISGWMFLGFLLKQNPEQATGVLQETLRRTRSFLWRNETVWYFLQIAMSTLPVDVYLLIELKATLKELQVGAHGHSDGRNVLNQAATWITRLVDDA